MTLTELLTPIKERLEKATPGDWRSDSCGDVFTTAEKEFCPGMDQKIFRTIGTTTCGPDRGDAEFIANCRVDIERLIKCVEVMNETIEACLSNEAMLTPNQEIIGIRAICSMSLSEAQSILRGENG